VADRRKAARAAEEGKEGVDGRHKSLPRTRSGAGHDDKGGGEAET
jgi:hypothetical protein